MRLHSPRTRSKRSWITAVLTACSSVGRRCTGTARHRGCQMLRYPAHCRWRVSPIGVGRYRTSFGYSNQQKADAGLCRVRTRHLGRGTRRASGVRSFSDQALASDPSRVRQARRELPKADGPLIFIGRSRGRSHHRRAARCRWLPMLERCTRKCSSQPLRGPSRRSLSREL